MDAGLPNILGQETSNFIKHQNATCKGALFREWSRGVSSGLWGDSGSSYSDISFDASLSDSIYGSSSTVTPLSEACKFVIRY